MQFMLTWTLHPETFEEALQYFCLLYTSDAADE